MMIKVIRIKRTLKVTWLTGLVKRSDRKHGLTGPFELMNLDSYKTNTIYNPFTIINHLIKLFQSTVIYIYVSLLNKTQIF